MKYQVQMELCVFNPSPFNHIPQVYRSLLFSIPFECETYILFNPSASTHHESLHNKRLCLLQTAHLFSVYLSQTIAVYMCFCILHYDRTNIPIT